MVNGNYVLYGDRPASESEVVDDHVQERTAERRTRRKPHRNANELQHTLNMAQRDNETDSVKFEKIKEPRLLRYVPTTEIEENYVTEKFETYDLKPTEEHPRRYAFVKKPKNPTDGSINYAYSRSSSGCSSPNNNLPTISEHGEQYGTYRVRAAPNTLDDVTFESKLEKYFAKPRETKKLGPKGSHPDSLYRVPTATAAGAGPWTRLLRALRWPAALVAICIALAVFVYFLMPNNLDTDLDVANSTYWEPPNAAGVGANLVGGNKRDGKKNQTQKNGGKTPEIDFYDADTHKKYDVVSLLDNVNDHSKRKLPVVPVFPKHITPEVQYGNEKADTDKIRNPKLLETTNAVQDSTVKPHITQKPEKPLAIYFKDATTETISRAESSNDFTNEEKQYTNTGYTRYPTGVKLPAQGKRTNYEELSPEFQEFYGRHRANVDVNFTSGHSKLFGLSIEEAEKMKSTTQSSVYNTRVSPTLPTWRGGDDLTTKKYPVVNSADVPQCRSPRLALCRGVLPYDLAGSAVVIDGVDITTLLPQIEYLVATNCSDRLKQFMCSLLEPECSPPPYPMKMPCFNLCQAIVDNCEGYVPRELVSLFNCRKYNRNNCVGARAPCGPREMLCGDGTCVLRDWICDGTRDCPGGEDESICLTCEKHEFLCPSGTCIPKQWTCDGYSDCPKGEDESEATCQDRRLPLPLRDGRPELGEELSGSAPAPSVRKPNRVPEPRHRSDVFRTGEFDSSKELLVTSDSNNALKRNYTRRPSPSRLTPYRPKLRHFPKTTQSDEDISTEQTTRSLPLRRYEYKSTTRKPVENAKEIPDSMEDVNMGDLTFMETIDKVRNGQNDNIPSPVKPKPVHKPALVPSLPEPTQAKPSTKLDKTINKFEKVIDGAAMLRKAVEDQAKEDRLAVVETSYEKYDDVPVNTGHTSHSSPCPSGELRCVDGRCITLAQLCDGTIDCTDHADEDNCYT